jgi:hypothetical protein
MARPDNLRRCIRLESAFAEYANQMVRHAYDDRHALPLAGEFNHVGSRRPRKQARLQTLSAMT